MRRKADWRFAGFLMVAAGIAIMIWRNAQEPDWVGIGRVLVIVGAVVAAYAKLKIRVGPIHDAWLDGRDVGREEGFEEGFEAGQKARPERPGVIDMAAARREHAARISDPSGFVAATRKPEA